MKSLINKKVIIIGGTGGLGNAYAKGFINDGADVLITGRNEDKLKKCVSESSGQIKYAVLNTLSEDSINKFVCEISKLYNSIDIVVNATGYDVRKSLEKHTNQEIDLCIKTNLTADIMLVKALLPYMSTEKGSVIVNTGAFGCKVIASPYQSADVASRAGLYAFTESINRELRQQGRNVRVVYFSPNCVDTEAEQPFIKLAKSMKIKIDTKEEVYCALKKTILSGKNYKAMGFGVTAFGIINAISPKFADFLLMNKYSSILQNYLCNENSENHN